MRETNSSLAGYPGRLSTSDSSGDLLWFATESDLGESAEGVAYALRAFIASDKHPELEQDGAREAVEVLNVEVGASDHETGGGHKTVSALLRRRPAERD